jgi:alpha-beta hydrolase superfamily lysophospholipase
MHEERILLESETGPEGLLFLRSPDDEDVTRPAVVVCPGFIQNRRAFELPGRSFLEHLRQAGLWVYALEMPKHEPKEHVGIATYVDHHAAAAVRFVAQRHARTAWLGHSMGGLIGVSLPPDVVASLFAMVTIGAPLKPGGLGVRPTNWIERGVVRGARGLAKNGRTFKGSLIARAFRRGRPVLHRNGVRYPLQVWAPDGLAHGDDLDQALLSSFVDDSWGALADMVELLVSDGERMGEVPVGERLRALDLPLLVVAGDHDGLAPRRSTRPLYDRAGSREKELLLVGQKENGVPFGHIDLLVGRHAPEHVWRPVTSFLFERAALLKKGS